MRLILIRHYKTQFNVSKQIMGWGDSPQAENWLDDLQLVERALNSHGFRPDVIFSSALQRSRRTAEYFARRLDVSRLEMTADLNEVNYGTLYGKGKQFVAEHYPLHKKDPAFVYPQGESFSQMRERAVACIDTLAKTWADDDVLCVAHSGVVRALLSHFLDLDYTAQLRRKISHRYVGVLTFQSDTCVAYEEWGQASGFVTEGAVSLPYSRQSA